MSEKPQQKPQAPGKQDRRQFLGSSLAGLGWVAFGAGCATTLEDCRRQIANRPVRRDIDTLATNDPIVEAYKSAVTQMKALPATDKRSWQHQASIHNNHCPHGNWLFLPWHRYYLTYFERICRSLSGLSTFALPYWNWTKNPRIPQHFWGGAGNPLFDGTRGIDSDDAISSAFVGNCVVDSILDDPNFLTFASDSITLAQGQRTRSAYGRLEGTPHNVVHSTILGNMGGFMSPLDPVFWCHHNMIERCWVEWEFVRSHSNTNDTNWTDRHFTEFSDEAGAAVDVTVGVSSLLPILSYQFDDVPTVEACAREMRRMTARNTKINRPLSKPEQDQMIKESTAGAKVALEVLRRAQAGQKVVAEIDKPATVSARVGTETLKTAARQGQRTLIRLDGVNLNASNDFAVKVFVNAPDAGPETPETDPRFAGGIAFFNHGHGAEHAHHGASDRGNFIIDATNTIERLGATEEVSLKIVLVPFMNRQLKVRSLDIGAVEVHIVKDVIEKK